MLLLLVFIILRGIICDEEQLVSLSIVCGRRNAYILAAGGLEVRRFFYLCLGSFIGFLGGLLAFGTLLRFKKEVDNKIQNNILIIYLLIIKK